jgi:hypothetical protein
MKAEGRELSFANSPKRSRQTKLAFPTRNTARYAKYRVEGFMPLPSEQVGAYHLFLDHTCGLQRII